MTGNVRLWTTVLTLPAVFACSDTTGPDAMAELRVAVEPTTIAPEDSFVVTVQVVNPTGRPMRLTSGCGGALYLFGIAGDSSMYLSGSDQICLAVARTVELPAGGRTIQYGVRLARMDGERVEPGKYRIEAIPLASKIDDRAAWAEVHVKEE